MEQKHIRAGEDLLIPAGTSHKIYQNGPNVLKMHVVYKSHSGMFEHRPGELQMRQPRREKESPEERGKRRRFEEALLGFHLN